MIYMGNTRYKVLIATERRGLPKANPNLFINPQNITTITGWNSDPVPKTRVAPSVSVEDNTNIFTITGLEEGIGYSAYYYKWIQTFLPYFPVMNEDYVLSFDIRCNDNARLKFSSRLTGVGNASTFYESQVDVLPTNGKWKRASIPINDNMGNHDRILLVFSLTNITSTSSTASIRNLKFEKGTVSTQYT